MTDYLNLARSEAIQRGRVVRVGLVTSWEGKPDAAYRTFGTWVWDDQSEEFQRAGNWEILPDGIVVEDSFPEYVRNSSYATDRADTVQAQYPQTMETRVIELDTALETGAGDSDSPADQA